jgi:hypothetical protein
MRVTDDGFVERIATFFQFRSARTIRTITKQVLEDSALHKKRTGPGAHQLFLRVFFAERAEYL